MAFNTQDILSAMDKYKGFHKPSHFLVRITPPSFMGASSAEYNKDIEFLCDATTLPGIQLDSVQVRPLGYGNPESRPIDYVPAAVRLDMFVDNQGKVLQYFQKWMGNILNFARDINKSSDGTRLNYYEFAYPKDYEGQVQIYVYDSLGNKFTVYTLDHAWPSNIGDLTLAWELNDQVSKLNVTFAYNLWHSDSLPYNSDKIPQGLNFPSLRNNLPATAVAAPNTPSVLDIFKNTFKVENNPGGNPQ
jgi:hypothetical protein